MFIITEVGTKNGSINISTEVDTNNGSMFISTEVGTKNRSMFIITKVGTKYEGMTEVGTTTAACLLAQRWAPKQQHVY